MHMEMENSKEMQQALHEYTYGKASILTKTIDHASTFNYMPDYQSRQQAVDDLSRVARERGDTVVGTTIINSMENRWDLTKGLSTVAVIVASERERPRNDPGLKPKYQISHLYEGADAMTGQALLDYSLKDLVRGDLPVETLAPLAQFTDRAIAKFGVKGVTISANPVSQFVYLSATRR